MHWTLFCLFSLQLCLNMLRLSKISLDPLAKKEILAMSPNQVCCVTLEVSVCGFFYPSRTLHTWRHLLWGGGKRTNLVPDYINVNLLLLCFFVLTFLNSLLVFKSNLSRSSKILEILKDIMGLTKFFWMVQCEKEVKNHVKSCMDCPFDPNFFAGANLSFHFHSIFDIFLFANYPKLIRF